MLTEEGERTYEVAIAQHQSDIEREFGSKLTEQQQRAVADALRNFWQD